MYGLQEFIVEKNVPLLNKLVGNTTIENIV